MRLTLDDLAGDPHRALAGLRAGSPVAWVDAMDGWLVTSRELALAVMRDPDLYTVDDPRFSTARMIGPSMLSVDGDEHTRHRGAFAHAFRLAQVRNRFATPVMAEAEALLARLRGDTRADLREAFSGPLAARIVAGALGLEHVPPPAVLDWYRAIVDGVSRITAGEDVPAEAQAAVARLDAELRRALVQPSTGSLLAGPVAGARLTEQEALSNAAVIMFGGIDTTDGMLANAVWHLLSHPDQLELVRTGAATAAQALEESLRLEPAAALIDRYARRDARLGATRIAAGDLVRVSIAAANRDPSTFPTPDRFEVLRPNARRHLGFAQGPHACLGMHLARLEGTVAIDLLLDRLPGLRLDPAAAGVAPAGLIFRRPPQLPVRWDRAA